MMATALHDKMKSVGSKRRKKIEARAAELVAEEMALRELRKAHHRTQVSMAKQLGISQDGVSRLEKRSDLLLSTLRNYVEAMGGVVDGVEPRLCAAAMKCRNGTAASLRNVLLRFLDTKMGCRHQTQVRTG